MSVNYKIRTGLSGKLLRLLARLAFRGKIIGQYLKLKHTKNPRFLLKWSDRWLQLRDATQYTAFDKHYIYHTAWAARVLAERRPKLHIDVSSSLYFVGTVSAFIPIRFLDYRPANLNLGGVEESAGDLHSLPCDDKSVESLSCMHVIEHIGLGRYGEPLDYEGDVKAARELKRVISPGGILLIVVPIGGTAKIQFNAHRIYRYEQIVQMFSGMSILEFALISEDNKTDGLIRHADPKLAEKQTYGCGCFLFQA